MNMIGCGELNSAILEVPFAGMTGKLRIES